MFTYAAALKPIYRAETAEVAREQLEAFDALWSKFTIVPIQRRGGLFEIFRDDNSAAAEWLH